MALAGTSQETPTSFQFLIGKVKMQVNVHVSVTAFGFQFLIGKVKIKSPGKVYISRLNVSIPYR